MVCLKGNSIFKQKKEPDRGNYEAIDTNPRNFTHHHYFLDIFNKFHEVRLKKKLQATEMTEVIIIHFGGSKTMPPPNTTRQASTRSSFQQGFESARQTAHAARAGDD